MNKNQSGREWIKDAVLYQIYPQSYYDSNGDGIGDLPGIIKKLDYIASLGVNLIWLCPCFDSPFNDAGYDVRNFYKIAPRYGTNKDMERLCAEAQSSLTMPAAKNVTPEIQQFMAKNNSVLFSMADELHLLQDGSFKLVCSIAECLMPSDHGCSQVEQKPMLPIEAYNYLVYSDL